MSAPVEITNLCPRCGTPLALIPGWVEYGDRMVDILEYGCWICGYVQEEYSDPNPIDGNQDEEYSEN